MSYTDSAILEPLTRKSRVPVVENVCCSSGKLAFAIFKHGQQYLHKSRTKWWYSPASSVYRCRECSYWHITSSPKADIPDRLRRRRRSSQQQRTSEVLAPAAQRSTAPLRMPARSRWEDSVF